MRRARRLLRVDDDIRDAGLERRLQSVAQSPEALALGGALLDHELGRAREPDGRRPRSCDPPWSNGSITVPRRMNSAPTPLGAPILCPEIVRRLNGWLFASMDTVQYACTASVWNTISRSRAFSAIAGIGCIVPTSLFTHMTEQTATSGRI
jgi:hypothetical protein